VAPDRIRLLGTKVPFVPLPVRKLEPITPEQFAAALEAAKWTLKDEAGGWTILHFDRATFLRAPMGYCIAYMIAPTEARRYIPDNVEA
jgi:hypothetical protein